MTAWLWVVIVLLVAHELGHLLAMLTSGGRFTGMVFDGWRVGIRYDITAVPVALRAGTALTGSLAELVTVVVALVLHAGPWLPWCVLGGVNAIINLVPWHASNDGAVFRALRQQARP